MLKKVDTALLISEVPSFCNTYSALAQDIGVKLIAESSWKKIYRIGFDVVIFGSSHLDEIDESYYSKSVIILKNGENPAKFIKLGIEHFIFDYENQYELLIALFKTEPVVMQIQSKQIQDVIVDSGSAIFYEGDYDFRFDKNVFKYKGKPIYLCKSQRVFLAQWLLGGHKENSKRMVLCNLRKKFGSDFLADVDRFGQIRRNK